MPKEEIPKKVTAEDLAKKQKEISISEFFLKNRHLLGFDNPLRALLMTIKEAVDNSLDAATDIGVLPEVIVEIKQINEERFIVSIEDNGPGIVKQQIPNIFGKLLYGSKFHSLRQNRGQQGIGICMLPETLIPFGDGKILPIKEIVENKSNGDLFVLTPDLKLALGRIDKFWKIPAPSHIISLKTLGGREVTLTPENPVLVRYEEGFKWKEAETINVGDYIAISRKLPVHIPDNNIPIFDLLDDDVQIDNYDFVLKIIYELKKKYGTWNKVGNKFSIKKDRLKKLYNKPQRNRPTKGLLKLFCLDLNISKDELIESCRVVGRRGTYLNIPKFVDEDFMRFLGFISGDGYSQPKTKSRWGRNISFWNNNEELRKEFNNIVKRLFGIKTYNIKHSKGRGEMVQFSSSLVSQLINKFGISSGKKSDIFYLDSLTHRKDLLRPYLQALFDCEGSVSVDRRNISIMLRNKKFIEYISLFLLEFGIVNRINKQRNDLRVMICGEENIKKFYYEVGFSHPEQNKKLEKILNSIGKNDKKSHLEKIPFINKQLVSLKNKFQLKNNDFQYPHIFSRNRPITYPVLRSTYETFLSNTETKKVPLELQELHCLLNSDIIFVPITNKTKQCSKEPFVYDLTMQQGNNFIANGILVHNSASVLYGQLTTGKSAKIISKTDPKKPAHYFELTIDTKNNKPEILKEEQREWNKDHGTRIEIELTGKYQKGKQSVDEYLKQTAIVNPHLHLIYISPLNERIEFPRATNQLPPETKEIKPHPYGIELGTLIKMLQDTNANTLSGFLQNDFCRIGPTTAKEICNAAGLSEKIKPNNISPQDAEKLFNSIQSAKVIAPPTDCLSPIGQDLLEKGLRKEINAEFYVATTRPPSVYRGFPFILECAIAYGGELEKEGSARLLRFANRVPLLYQQGACAITESVTETNWKPYGLQQSANSLPAGPLVVAIHFASVWVPFTSEAKEALAHYPEIIKEIKLALQECGRKLSIYIHKNVRAKEQKEKIGLFEKYIPELARSLAILSDEKENKIKEDMERLLKKNLKTMIEEVEPKEE